MRTEDIIRDAISERLKQRQDMSVRDIAKRVGVDPARVYEYLRGVDVGVSRAIAMLRACGMQLTINAIEGEIPDVITGARRQKSAKNSRTRPMIGPLPQRIH